MSLAPRPVSTPSSMRGSNGSPSQPSPGRDDVEVAGKAEMRRARAAHRDEILDRPVGRLAADEAMDVEAERRERGFEHVEHLAAGGGDAGAGDEPGGEVDGVDATTCHGLAWRA